MKHAANIWLSVVAVIGFMVAAASADNRIVELDQQFSGKSYNALVSEWTNWLVVEPIATNPAFDPAGRFCDSDQEGRAWFLASTFGGVVDRTCEVPPGKAIFISLGGVFVSFPPDFPMMGDPCLQLATALEQVRCDVNDDVVPAGSALHSAKGDDSRDPSWSMTKGIDARTMDSRSSSPIGCRQCSKPLPWDKAVFDPWHQETWDVNDTALIADPATDPDVGEYFQRLAASDYLPTWYAQRQGGVLGPLEQATAAKTAVHAVTPSVTYADSLGRAFLTVAHNRFEQHSTGSEEQFAMRVALDTVIDEHYATRVVFDIEGNQRSVIDANDRVVMRYDYDMLGTRIHQASMEAGERWMLNDVAGQPIDTWDSRGHQFHTTYDALRRPTESFLREGAGAELVVSRIVYGENQPNPEAHNLRGKVVQLFDQAGVVTSDEYDFKSNLLAGRRQLAREHKTTLDWSTDPALDAQVFTSSATYDALNRPTSAASPDGSVYRPRFNEANLLKKGRCAAARGGREHAIRDQYRLRRQRPAPAS